MATGTEPSTPLSQTTLSLSFIHRPSFLNNERLLIIHITSLQQEREREDSTTTTKAMSSFQFVLIPSDSSKPIQQLSESTDGGLTNDKLIAHARNYFGDDNICDIMALTIPLPTNNYQAVSMYHCDSSSDEQNQRAIEVIVGCGMNSSVSINGDVFIGRCVDNEPGDIWKRIDFTIEDTNPSSAWCKAARASNAGKSSATPSSLSGILQKQFNPGNTNVIQPPQQDTSAMFGQNGNFVKDNWGVWSQTDDEMELKLYVPQGTKAKDVTVKFQRNALTVNCSGTTLVSGQTFDPIDVDECTYTIQDSSTSKEQQQNNDNTRELCITLTKANIGSTWSYALK